MELWIPESHSLKEKRQVVRPLVDRVRARVNVSVAETDGQDTWQRCQIAFAAVATQELGVHKLLDAAQEIVETSPDLECTHIDREVW